MLDVGIKETTTTTGTGTVTLTAVANHARVSDAFGVDTPVGYCLISGNGDKEWGIGIAGAGNTLARSIISATLVGTTYTKNGSAISLTGTSELIVTESGAAAVAGALYLRSPGGANSWNCPYIVTAASLTTVALVANRVYYVPFQMQASLFPLASVGVAVTAAVASSTANVAVYESAVVGGILVPGLRIASASLDTSTTGNKTSAISFTPRPGALYWLSVASSLAPTIRAINAEGRQSQFLGFGIGNLNANFYAASTGSTPPADASGETFSVISSGAVPAIFLGH